MRKANSEVLPECNYHCHLPAMELMNGKRGILLGGKKNMIIRVINQLSDDSFPEKIISKGQVATAGHFVDKAPEAQSVLLPLDVRVELH